MNHTELHTELLGENEAARLVGLSLNTLNRFAEAGYLKTEVDAKDARCFRRRDLELLFGANVGETESVPPDLAKPEESDLSSSPSATWSLNSPNDGGIGAAHENAPESPLELVDDFFISSSTAADYGRGLTTDRHDQPERSRPEIAKISRILALQEQLMELQSGEISELKEQRQWLQKRVEKLEELTDRDQLLLLSETQMLTRLLTLRQRPSPMRLALEWLGLSSPQNNSNQQTFEVRP